MDSKVRAQKANPMATANALSRLLFWWLNPLFKVGYKRKLEEDDMFNVLYEDSSCKLRTDLERAWNMEKCNYSKPRLLRALWRCYGKGWILLGIPLVFEESMKVAQPLLMSRLILYFSPGSHVTLTEAYLCALGISACALLSGMVHHQIYFLTTRWGWRKKVACCSMIYKKALRLSNTALLKTTTGQIVNLMSNDVNRFDLGFQFIHYLWIGPVEAIVVSAILWGELGPSCLAGLGFMVFLFPVQSAMGKLFSKFRSQTAHRTDERVRTMSEIISAMRVIKMYTWEEPFGKLVAKQRRCEVQKIAKAVTCQGLNLTFSFISVRVISLLAFLTYTLLGNTITASKVFTAIALYNVLQFTLLKFLPIAVQFLSEVLIAIHRIQNFLLLDEVRHPALSNAPEKNEDGRPTSNLRKEAKGLQGFSNNAFISHVHDEQDKAKPSFSGKAMPDVNYTLEKSPSLVIIPSVVASNLSAKWDESKEVQTLMNVNFKVTDGQLLTVVGSVGSGKSSLLSVLLGELPTSSGEVKVDGQVLYAAQQSWVFSSTVRQNIVFGLPFEHLKYWKIIDCCGLSKDLEAMPNGDLTLVGDRGITLSGGQKARINLARAVYRDADIYLLDDPLSAVDAKVGRLIFERCIQGMLKNKVRILVTHQLQYLIHSDQILIMNEGKQLAVGTYPELLEQGFAFSDLICAGKKDDGQTVLPSTRLLQRQSSIRSGVLEALDTIDDEPADDTAAEEQDEDRFEGGVSLKVYWDYLTAGFGKLGLVLSLVLNVVYQGSYVFTDWWLAHWAAKEEEYLNIRTQNTSQNISEKGTTTPTVDTNLYLYVFTGVTVAVVVLSTVRTLFMFYNCIMASHNLHNTMFHAIIRTPILFFDTNPVGRILNRFSKDMGQLDEQLPWQFVEFVQVSRHF
ncbi:ABCC4 [Branchiostoma lanceolatum]|uniref:ABCC4 protein n=1 Tax=Branchiostoma lanceolatum TaxID=7740 RepID=A0A8K0EQK0_BRALA|nr:ABCC4 [Branchiostoma lanceolatum]